MWTVGGVYGDLNANFLSISYADLIVKNTKYRPDIEAEDNEKNSRQLSNDLSRILNIRSTVLDIGVDRGQFAKVTVNCFDAKKYFFIRAST
jgi:hypothetical protein